MRKGVLDMCILSLLSSEAMYTSDIIDKLKSSQLVVVEGTLYPLLTRLKNAGYLEYFWMESNSGPPRKYFLLTPAGEQFYKELEETWNELANAVNALTGARPQTHPNNDK